MSHRTTPQHRTVSQKCVMEAKKGSKRPREDISSLESKMCARLIRKKGRHWFDGTKYTGRRWELPAGKITKGQYDEIIKDSKQHGYGIVLIDRSKSENAEDLFYMTTNVPFEDIQEIDNTVEKAEKSNVVLDRVKIRTTIEE